MTSELNLRSAPPPVDVQPLQHRALDQKMDEDAECPGSRRTRRYVEGELRVAAARYAVSTGPVWQEQVGA